MKIINILPLIIFAFFQVLPFAVKASDQVSYDDYYNQEDVVRFFEQGTMDDFEHVPPELRAMVLAGLMNQPDHDENDRDYFQIVDRKEIFQKYYDTLSQEDKEKVYTYAFDFAVSNRDQRLATSFFDQAVQSNVALAQKFICFAIAVDDGEDGDGYNGNASQVAVMIPLIAKTPGLANQVCEINQNGRKVTLTVGQIVSSVSPVLYAKMYQQSQRVDPVSETVFREYSTCSVAQVKQNMFESMRPLKDARAGSSVYVEVREDKCVISGILKKQKNGFEFAPSLRGVGYMKQTFLFQTLDQIVSYLKANPQRVALTQRVDPPKGYSYKTELRPDLSQAYGANFKPNSVRPESGGKPSSAHDLPPTAATVANPFGMSLSETLKSIFGAK